METTEHLFTAPMTEPANRKETRLPKHKRILVPIDFSEPSIKALRHARELAVKEKVQIILVNVVEEPTTFRTLDARGERRSRYEQRVGRLRELAERELGSNMAARIEIREGNPSVEIARLASRSQVDLIVVGRHERHGLRRWFHGHTTTQLSKSAPCSLLLLDAGRLN